MDVFRELMEKLGPGTYVMLCTNGSYCLSVPKPKRLGEQDIFFDKDPIVALEEALEAKNEQTT